MKWGDLVSLAGVVGAIIAWEAVVQLGWVNPFFSSSPSRVVVAAMGLWDNPALATDLWFTTRGFLLAMGVAIGIGVPLGLLTGVSDVAYRLFNPWIVALNSLPKIAVMPLVLLWFGMGLKSQVFLGALMAGFPIVTSTQSGARSFDRAHLMLAQSLGASQWMVVRSVLLPGLMPFVLAGLRVGVTYAMVGVLIVEFFGSSAGVGYRMVLLSSNYKIDAFFVLLLLVVCWTLSWTMALKAVEDHVGAWRTDEA
jgi:NitT/TauT family transport system permease protein